MSRTERPFTKCAIKALRGLAGSLIQRRLEPEEVALPPQCIGHLFRLREVAFARLIYRLE
jgi:hypothetical protein